MATDPRIRYRLWRERRHASGADPNFIGFDKYRRSGAYHWLELDRSPEYREKVDLVAQRTRPTDRVLDVGCGDGAYLSVIGPICGEAVGVDADADAVRLANSKLLEAGHENVRCVQMPISGIPTSDLGGAFDVIYSMDVIEHLPEPSELLRAVRAVSAPGASIVIGTPLYLGKALKSPYHVHEFNEKEIRKLLAEHFDLDDEQVLAGRRLDGEIHEASFYVGFCRAGA